MLAMLSVIMLALIILQIVCYVLFLNLTDDIKRIDNKLIEIRKTIRGPHAAERSGDKTSQRPPPHGKGCSGDRVCHRSEPAGDGGGGEGGPEVP